MRDPLNAVILAGGKSERLAGIVPPHHKPFMVVDGESLLLAAVEHARAVGAERIVVVAVGENALPVSQLIGDARDVRIVLAAGGVGRALRTGLEMCVTDRVLVLMSDNVHHRIDVMATCARRYAVGVQYCADDRATRFTRVEDNRWVEGPTDRALDGSDLVIWCGPLLVSRDLAYTALQHSDDRIGPYIAELAPYGEMEFVLVSSYDVGTPDAARRATQSEGVKSG